jgi:excisionase family DNA binding protein
MSTITQLSRAEFPSRLYRVEEAAEILNIKPKTMRNRISLGQIDIYRVGRGIRISRETLEEIIGCGYVPARKNPRLRKIADVSSGEETNDGAVSSRVDQNCSTTADPVAHGLQGVGASSPQTGKPRRMGMGRSLRH